MTGEEPSIEPQAPAGTPLETTFRAVGLGFVLSIVMVSANIYLGLYAGMTVSASIPAAVVSMAILRGILRRGTILENNIAQTMASAGESLAAGAIFTIPALVLVGAWTKFHFLPTMVVTMFGGLLGVVFMVPMRRSLIAKRPDLKYPEGVACSQVLMAGQEGGAGFRMIALGLVIGGAVKFLASGIQLIRGTIDGAVAHGRTLFYAGCDVSPALVAVGYIVGLDVAVLVFLGGFLAWDVALPLLGEYAGDGTPMETAKNLWASNIRYIGVGAMLVGGLHSVWRVRKGLLESLRNLRAARQRAGAGEVERVERDVPLPLLTAVVIAAGIAIFITSIVLTHEPLLAVLATVLALAAGFLFVAVATYIVGLVGSTNSPVSGMTICAVLVAAGVLLLFGLQGHAAIIATLVIAGVVCCAASTAGDIAQDLKTGLIVGATPAKQQWTQLVAVIASSLMVAPTLTLLHHAYGIGTGEPGALPAPQAALFAGLTEGLFGDGGVPWNMAFLGVGVGIALIVVNSLLERSHSRFRTHVMPVAVGIYLPLSLSTPILLGGLLRHWFGQRDAEGQGRDAGVLFGSGLIAGEALMGIALAVPICLQWKFWDFGGGLIASLCVLAAILGLYAWIANRRLADSDGAPGYTEG